MTETRTPDLDLDAIRARRKKREENFLPYDGQDHTVRCAKWDYERLINTTSTDIDALLKRIDELETTGRNLVQHIDARDGSAWAGMDHSVCQFCGKELEWVDYNECVTSQYTGHAEDCVFVLAQKALED